MEVTKQQQQHRWCFTGSYGFLEIERRRESWDLLRNLEDKNLSWYKMGDFNDILSNEVKRSHVDCNNPIFRKFYF